MIDHQAPKSYHYGVTHGLFTLNAERHENINMKTLKLISVAAVLAACIAGASHAGPITGSPETWTTSGQQGWSSALGVPNLSNAGGAGGYLLITFVDEGGGPPDPLQAQDTIYTASSPAANTFTGDYIASNVMRVGFNFYNDSTPTSAKLVFYSSSSSREWSSDITPSTTGWHAYSIYFSYSSWTAPPGANATDFLADLQAVSWIGISIVRGGTGTENYGLDDFELYVPEPADFFLFAAGLLGLTLAMRQRRRTCAQSSGSPA